MRTFEILILVVVCLILGACTTARNGAVTSLPKTLDAACDFYRDGRPAVVQYVDWAKANWDAKVPGTETPVIADEQKTLLLKLYEYLPKLDALGQDVCHISEALKAVAEGRQRGIGNALKNADWDEVLSVVLKVATTAAQLKAKGTF